MAAPLVKTKGINDLQPDDDLTEILEDKKFFDYLLQSLSDHYGKLLGLHYVKRQPLFTQEFFANYWLQLMKIAQFDSVPFETFDDHEYQGKNVYGFHSIYRSIFKVCESRIDLRLTTVFALNDDKLADEENVEDRVKFMLILLFVAFWVADKKGGHPKVMVKEPMAQLVHACFNKYFKDIYRGNDDAFKTFIFADNKEQSLLSPFPSSPNRLNKSALPSSNVTPNVQKSLQSKMLTCDVIIDRLTSTVNKLEYEKEVLRNELDIKKNEFQTIKILHSDLFETKRDLQNELAKSKDELAISKNLVIQKDAEMKNILGQFRALKDAYGKLLKELDNGNEILDGEKLNEPFNERDDNIDSDAGGKEHAPKRVKKVVRTLTEFEITAPQRTSSFASSFLMFSLSLFMFMTLGIYLFGAPVQVYNQTHHDHLPPQ